MALDGAGDRKRKVFFPDTDTFFCDIDFVGDRKGITVNVILRQEMAEVCPAMYQADVCHPSMDPLCTGSWGGPLQGVNYEISLGESVPALGTQTLAFQFSKVSASQPCGPASFSGTPDPFPFPVGHFACEVSVDGALQGKAEFDIIYPGDPAGGTASACPFSPVAEGSNCFDYVKPGAHCPEANLNILCECDQTGTWSNCK